MAQARRVRFGLAVAVVAAIAISGGSVWAQLPNPYNACESWDPQLPEGRTLGQVVAVAVDRDGHIWVLDRCGQRPLVPEMDPCVHSNVAPIMEFDSTGKFLKSIGAGLFVFPHSLYLDKDDNVWVADDTAKDGKGSQVIKFSHEGKVLLTLGKAGVYGISADTFIGPTDVVVAPNGDIFVADGHQVAVDPPPPEQEARVVKFSKDGKFIKVWGKAGKAPGEFAVVHAIAMDSTGRVFVGDRGNGRIQIFDQEGRLLEVWRQFGEPRGIFIDGNDTMFVTAGGMHTFSETGDEPGAPRGIRIASTKDGVVTGYIPPRGPEVEDKTSQLRVAADAKGDLYVAGFNSLLRKCVKK